MSKKRLDVDWKRKIGAEDIKPALKKHNRYLEENGLRKSTISSYVFRVGKFLESVKSDEPSFGSFFILSGPARPEFCL
jgi:hypothetical protein